MNAKRSVHLLHCFATFPLFATFAPFATCFALSFGSAGISFGSAARSSTSAASVVSHQQPFCVSNKAHQQRKTWWEGFSLGSATSCKKEIGTKYIIKRTVLGSTKTFSNTRFKVHSQDLKQLVEGRGRKVSPYKARLLERKKLSLIYGNLGWRELRKCVLQSKHKKGVASPKSGNKKTRPQTSSLPENLITLLESRLDVVLYRCRFFPSFSSCKQAINHGKIFVNHRQVRIAGHLLKGGDLIQVNPQYKQSLLVQSESTANPLRGTVSKKANYLLALENEKQKTLLHFQNKIKFRPFSPSFPSTLLTRFDPLHHFPWSAKQKPNRLNNTSNQLVADSKEISADPKEIPTPSAKVAKVSKVAKSGKVAKVAVPASVQTFNRTKTSFSLNLENQANSLFRDLKERKRILRTLSSTFNERLDGHGDPYAQHVMVRTDRLIKPLRNKDNPSLFLRPQSKNGVMRVTTGLRGLAPKSEHVNGLKKLFPPFYRAVKPLNLEVSYQTLTAIFLFPPQKVYFPAHIDLEMIGKSI